MLLDSHTAIHVGRSPQAMHCHQYFAAMVVFCLQSAGADYAAHLATP